MRRFLQTLISSAASIGLAACSAQDQQSAQRTANAVATSAKQAVQSVATAMPAAAKDAVTTTTVVAKLVRIDVDAATSVKVSTHDGNVTLTGQARSREEVRRYVQAAKTTSGVKRVTNALAVNPHLRSTRDSVNDAALNASVAAAIAAQTGINVFHVTPSTRDGTVTLTGTAPSASVKQTIVAAATGVKGVRRVIDAISVQPN